MRAIAGEGGLHKAVRWAHVSELEDPTPWLEGGELLMTTGIAIPRTAARQVAYVQRLVEADVAGIAIGDNMHAPPLSPSMLDVAHEADFPVTLVTREVPFIALAKTVAAANRDAMLKRLSTHLRVYETLHELAHYDADPVGLFERLAEISGYRLFLLSPSGEPLFAGLPTFSGCAVTAITECLERPTLTPLQVGVRRRLPISYRSWRVGAALEWLRPWRTKRRSRISSFSITSPPSRALWPSSFSTSASAADAMAASGCSGSSPMRQTSRADSPPCSMTRPTKTG